MLNLELYEQKEVSGWKVLFLDNHMVKRSRISGTATLGAAKTSFKKLIFKLCWELNWSLLKAKTTQLDKNETNLPQTWKVLMFHSWSLFVLEIRTTQSKLRPSRNARGTTGAIINGRIYREVRLRPASRSGRNPTPHHRGWVFCEVRWANSLIIL